MRNGTSNIELRTLLLEQQRIAQQIEHRRSEELRTLHTRLGFDSIDDLITALREISSGSANGARSSNGASAHTQNGRSREARSGGKGVRYSDAVKAAVKSALEKRQGTARAIATRYKISLATVNIWKRSWGLTKSRRKKQRAS